MDVIKEHKTELVPGDQLCLLCYMSKHMSYKNYACSKASVLVTISQTSAGP